MDTEMLIEHMLNYAMMFIGRPYVWGGKNAVWGYDCSELVQEALRSIGMDQPNDQTAQELYDHFLVSGERGVDGPGALVFFGRDARSISHVAIQLNIFQMVEAGGGDSSVTSPEIASTRYAAMVRIRPIISRRDLIESIMPNYVSALTLSVFKPVMAGNVQ